MYSGSLRTKKLYVGGGPVIKTNRAYFKIHNVPVVKNTTRPEESPIKKKHNYIAYHKARESIAAGIIRIAKGDGKTNIADILTKLLKRPTLRDLLTAVIAYIYNQSCNIHD